jgi:hypothetical protein
MSRQVVILPRLRDLRIEGDLSQAESVSLLESLLRPIAPQLRLYKGPPYCTATEALQRPDSAKLDSAVYLVEVSTLDDARGGR